MPFSFSINCSRFFSFKGNVSRFVNRVIQPQNILGNKYYSIIILDQQILQYQQLKTKSNTISSFVFFFGCLFYARTILFVQTLSYLTVCNQVQNPCVARVGLQLVFKKIKIVIGIIIYFLLIYNISRMIFLILIHT